MMVQQTIILDDAETRDARIDRLLRFLRDLPLTGKRWRIDVSQYVKRRSDQQNRYLWGVCYPAFLAALPGWEAEDVHEYMLGEHFGWERLEGMGRARMKPIRRSSKLNKQEFADYVDFIQRKAASLGIYIPDPGEVS